MPMNSQSEIFRVDKLCYSYHGRYPALREVDLVIKRGEQVVILGANGCGKSSLLKVLDGLYRPDAGRLHAFGEDVTDIVDDPLRSREYHRRVGLVFQDPDI